MDFPGGASGKGPTYQRRKCKGRGFNAWVGKIPWRRAWQPTPVFLPGESHGQRSLARYGPWGCKELDTTEVTYHMCIINIYVYYKHMDFPGGSAGKESACNAGNLGSIPGLGRSPGEGSGYSLQYSGLENSMDNVVHGVTKSWT